MNRADIMAKGRGYFRDPKDPNDFKATARRPVKDKTIFYDHLMLGVRDQGREGTCVGFATVGVKEYYDNKQRNTKTYFSPRHLYALCKQRDGIPNEEGTFPRLAMKMLQEFGVAFEKDWPYKVYDQAQPNFDRLAKKAVTQKIQTYARLYSTKDMIANLVLNGPFVAGVWVTDGWYTDECLETGLVDASIGQGPNNGGHAVAVVGYDAERRLFKARNSWGVEYGDNGFNWIPRAWMTEHCMDAWSIVDDEAIDAGLVVIENVGTPQQMEA